MNSKQQQTTATIDNSGNSSLLISGWLAEPLSLVVTGAVIVVVAVVAAVVVAAVVAAVMAAVAVAVAVAAVVTGAVIVEALLG